MAIFKIYKIKKQNTNKHQSYLSISQSKTKTVALPTLEDNHPMLFANVLIIYVECVQSSLSDTFNNDFS